MAGLREAGVRWAIEVIPWAQYPFGSLDNLRNLPRNRNRARIIAAKIEDYQTSYPRRPITLIGYSGGGGLALLVPGELAKGVEINRIILVAAAISPQFDLSKPLACCRNGLVSFYSPGDWFMVGLCTRIFGTIDRVHTDSAGRTGFLDAGGALRQTEDLRQMPYDPAWIRLAHDGGHFGWLSRSWAREVLARQVDTSLEAQAIL